jgi:hypothetical protein
VARSIQVLVREALVRREQITYEGYLVFGAAVLSLFWPVFSSLLSEFPGEEGIYEENHDGDDYSDHKGSQHIGVDLTGDAVEFSSVAGEEQVGCFGFTWLNDACRDWARAHDEMLFAAP